MAQEGNAKAMRHSCANKGFQAEEILFPHLLQAVKRKRHSRQIIKIITAYINYE